MKYLTLLLALSITAPVLASPLDLIYDAPGNFWGRVDASPTSSDNVTHTQFNIEQGWRFKHVQWLTFYGAFTWWQQVAVAKSGYWSAGVKNTTWIPHFIIGIEEEQYVISEPSVAATNIVVGYVSTSYDWNLKRGN